MSEGLSARLKFKQNCWGKMVSGVSGVLQVVSPFYTLIWILRIALWPFMNS